MDPFDFENGVPTESIVPEEANIALPKRKGCTRLAWLVILGLVGLMAARSNIKEEAGETAQHERLQDILFEIQARYLVGAANFVPDGKDLYEQAKPLEKGTLDQRLRFVVLAGELAGPQEALDKAKEVRAEIWAKAPPHDKNQKRLADLLVALYEDYVAGDFEAPSLTEQDRAFLREQFGWFGALALHPHEDLPGHPGLAAGGGAAAAIVMEAEQPDPAGREQVLEPAYNTFASILGAVGSICFVSFAGFVGLVIFLIMLAKRQLGSGLACGSNHGGVYAETFALFLILFIGLSLLFQWLPLEIPALAKASLVTIGSLAAVVWPVLRGIQWWQVRQEIGWTCRNPALEPAMGVLCYILALPIVVIGLGLSLVLMAVRNQLDDIGLGVLAQHEPIHPIVDFIVNGTAMDRFLVFVDACILAPIVEETMFRGVLYRHLREASQRWSWIWSIIFSGTIASFIFAVIHPQGIIAVPVLMSLAYGFTIAREWRGSLVPSMVGHGLNNGLVVLFVMLLMGG